VRDIQEIYFLNRFVNLVTKQAGKQTNKQTNKQPNKQTSRNHCYLHSNQQNNNGVTNKVTVINCQNSHRNRKSLNFIYKREKDNEELVVTDSIIVCSPFLSNELLFIRSREITSRYTYKVILRKRSFLTISNF